MHRLPPLLALLLCALAFAPASACARAPSTVWELTIDDREASIAVATRLRWVAPILASDRRPDLGTLTDLCLRRRFRDPRMTMGAILRLLVEAPRRCARDALLSRSMPLRFSDDDDPWLVRTGMSLQRGRTATFAISAADGWATVTVSATGHIVQTYPQHLGPWLFEVENDDRLIVRARTQLIPDAWSRTLVVRSGRSRVVSARPLPTAFDAHELGWREQAGAPFRSHLEVVLDPHDPTMLGIAGPSPDLVAFARAALAAVPILLLLLLLRARLRADMRVDRDDRATTAGARRAIEILTAVAALLALSDLADLLLQTEWAWQHLPLAPEQMRAWTGLTGAVGAIALLIAAPPGPHGWRGRRAVLAAALAAATATWAVMLQVDVLTAAVDSVYMAALACIGLAAVGYAAVARLGAAWVPELRRPQRPPVRLAITAAVLSFAIVATAQWADQVSRLVSSADALIWFGEPGAVPMPFWEQVRWSVPSYPSLLSSQLLGWLPFVVLAIVAAVLFVRGRLLREQLLLDSDPTTKSLLIIVFCGYTIGLGGSWAAFAVPLAFVSSLLLLPLVLLRRRERGVRELIARGRDGSDAPRSLLAARDELIDDAFGGRPATTDPRRDTRAARDLALAIGPAGSWWENGLAALRLALPLALLPVGYYLYVAVRGGFSDTSGYTTVSSMTNAVFTECAVWLAAGFTLGALLPYLPFRNGALKGVVLAAVWGVSAVPFDLLTHRWVRVPATFRLFELILFLAILGLLIDRRTIGARGWRGLFLLYETDRVRAFAGYAAPIAAAAYVVAMQVLSGDASEAVRTALERAPELLAPAGPGR